MWFALCLRRRPPLPQEHDRLANTRTVTTAYHRTESFDAEEFEDELVLMELESQAVVTLNRTGRMVWEALESATTLDQMGELLRGLFPDVDADTLRGDIQAVLDTLVAARLVAPEANEN